MNRYAVQELMAANACDVVMTDITWSGGITEARRIAYMADTQNLGIIFHDCTGPVTLAAGLHLSAHCTNSWMQEIVRSYTLGYYLDLVDHAFVVENSRMQPPQRPGIGVAINPAARDARIMSCRSFGNCIEVTNWTDAITFGFAPNRLPLHRR